MRVTIFGAHGLTGQLLTRDILDAGYDAIAITRHPDDLPLTAVPRLTVVGADATSEVAVQTCAAWRRCRRLHSWCRV
jgi:uncharacterized protein YbjT (DUF2867 family)